MAISTEMLGARTDNEKGIGTDHAIVSVSLACGATDQTCKENGANRRCTPSDSHSDVSLCEESAYIFIKKLRTTYLA